MCACKGQTAYFGPDTASQAMTSLIFLTTLTPRDPEGKVPFVDS